MTHNEELAGYKTKFAIASAALVFCTVWALIGVEAIRMLAVTAAFIYFLKSGIELEVCSKGTGGH